MGTACSHIKATSRTLSGSAERDPCRPWRDDQTWCSCVRRTAQHVSHLVHPWSNRDDRPPVSVTHVMLSASAGTLASPEESGLAGRRAKARMARTAACSHAVREPCAACWSSAAACASVEGNYGCVQATAQWWSQNCTCAFAQRHVHQRTSLHAVMHDCHLCSTHQLSPSS